MDSEPGSFGAIRGMRLPEDRPNMVGRCVGADEEGVGDALICVADGEQGKDFGFAP